MRLPLLIALLGFAGCAPAFAPIGAGGDFVTDRTTYSAGEDVRLTLHNDLGEVLGYTLCHVWLEREVGGAWVRSERQASGGCPERLHTLTPGAEARGAYPLPERIPSGRYRLSTQVVIVETGRRYPRHTGTFMVEGRI